MTLTAVRVINSLSIEELRALPSEVRRRLKEEIGSRCQSTALRRAVRRILEAELVELEYQPGMLIKGDGDFVNKTRLHLEYIAMTSLGERLLLSLAASRQPVTLVSTSRINETWPDNFEGALADGGVLRWRSISNKAKSIRGQGTGSGSTIKYNPDRLRIGASDWQRPLAGVWLAHELIHADDAAYGRMDPNEVDGIRNYERQAIGLPPYDQKELTENRLRAEWAEPQPLRPRY